MGTVLVMSTTGWHTMYLGVVALLLLQLLHPSTAQVGQEVDMLLCEQRQQDWTYKGRRYVFSGFATDLEDEGESSLFAAKDPSKNFTGVLRDFGNAVRHCTLRCMSLVSIETEGEWNFLKEKMEELRVPFIWTSGHKCDKTVSPSCYTEPSVQPRIVNGWYWSGSGSPIPATDKIPPGWSASPWGNVGLYSTLAEYKNQPTAVPQPDNAEQELKKLKQEEESCIALAQDHWETGIYWNDIACYHEKPWICEENEKLMRDAGLIN